ncbi:DUF4362 domain-containing protein [Clostridium sp. YIM B02505]|uniref:DUF4362 domain-containing protein n=1 Tax=Clostridium yunnanense TaxID=2800325 RepID=A0ABS1ES90_9CLOT|nr:DUF4362 domain-containing protein [Clostridium yunnanense]MBK1812158.1 DUF4362 domain-containing protein [Clostridium yunnanense]
MIKLFKIFVAFLVLTLIVVGIYWLIIHPKSYSYDTAVGNGDVVMGAGGKANIEKFHSFIKNVQNKQTDKIRITAYSKEGNPTIFDLDFDGKIIKCTTDNTRDLYGRELSKRYGEYTKIIKNDINDYSLVDETGKYKNQWIFQE